jgi:hypothetical protein
VSTMMGCFLFCVKFVNYQFGVSIKRDLLIDKSFRIQFT